MLNPEAQAKLEAILATSPESLTEGDIIFLKARTSYLTEDQINTFLPTEVEAPKKKTKKAVDASEEV